jgi:lactoylglutathione lyase
VAAKLRCEIFSSDLDATLNFYQRVLGFQVSRDERLRPNPYLALVRDGIEIGASAGPVVDHSHRRPPIGVELVIEVDELDAWFTRVVGAEWPVEASVERRAWGLRDLKITMTPSRPDFGLKTGLNGVNVILTGGC